jgi:murein DD-endopeptidase MepM/ murein hydrolase activator NlpD
VCYIITWSKYLGVSEIGDSTVPNHSRYARAQVRQTNRRRRRTVIVIVILVALLVGVGLGVLAFASRSSSKYVKVPDIEGLTYDQASAKLKAVNLGIEVDPTQDKTNLKVGAKKVGYQTPSSETNAEKDSVVTVSLLDVPSKQKAQTTTPVTTTPATQPVVTDTGMSAPMDGKPIYPYTKDASIANGHWSAGSTDYPYFGAPREGTRLHGAIDVYPPAGQGTPVKAIKDGTVVQIVPEFYIRTDGEKCWGALINHGDFVAFYGELASPVTLSVGQTVKRGQQIGAVSGTAQLHFEMYTPGTNSRGDWHGAQPTNLLDPTDTMRKLYGT